MKLYEFEPLVQEDLFVCLILYVQSTIFQDGRVTHGMGGSAGGSLESSRDGFEGLALDPVQVLSNVHHVLRPHWLGAMGARSSNCAPCCGCRTYAGTPEVLLPTCLFVCFDS